MAAAREESRCVRACVPRMAFGELHRHCAIAARMDTSMGVSSPIGSFASDIQSLRSMNNA